MNRASCVVCLFTDDLKTIGEAVAQEFGVLHAEDEVQCRTLLMDAWANVSHHLAYKGENSIPSRYDRILTQKAMRRRPE